MRIEGIEIYPMGYEKDEVFWSYMYRGYGYGQHVYLTDAAIDLWHRMHADVHMETKIDMMRFFYRGTIYRGQPLHDYTFCFRPWMTDIDLHKKPPYVKIGDDNIAIVAGWLLMIGSVVGWWDGVTEKWKRFWSSDYAKRQAVYRLSKSHYLMNDQYHKLLAMTWKSERGFNDPEIRRVLIAVEEAIKMSADKLKLEMKECGLELPSLYYC